MTLRVGALVAVLAAPAALAVEFGYGGQLRAELRGRTAQIGDRALLSDGAASVTGDLEFGAEGAVTFTLRQTVFTLGYGLNLLLREPQLAGVLLPSSRISLFGAEADARLVGTQVALMQRARLGLTQRFQGGTFDLNGDASLGTWDVGAARTAEGATPGSVPDVQNAGLVPYVRGALTAALGVQVDARVALGFTAGFSISGSPGTATTVLPLQWGPTGGATVRWAPTRSDGLTTSLTASGAWFDSPQGQFLATASETWDRRFNTAFSTTVGVGVGLAWQQPVADTNGVVAPATLEALPVFNLGARWTDGSLVSFSGAVNVVPFADRFTGAIYARGEARLEGQLQVDSRLSFNLAGGAGYALPIANSPQAGDYVLFAQGGAVWAAQEWLNLTVNLRVVWSAQPRLAGPVTLQGPGAPDWTVVAIGPAGQLLGALTISASVRGLDRTVW